MNDEANQKKKEKELEKKKKIKQESVFPWNKFDIYIYVRYIDRVYRDSLNIVETAKTQINVQENVFYFFLMFPYIMHHRFTF